MDSPPRNAAKPGGDMEMVSIEIPSQMASLEVPRGGDSMGQSPALRSMTPLSYIGEVPRGRVTPGTYIMSEVGNPLENGLHMPENKTPPESPKKSMHMAHAPGVVHSRGIPYELTFYVLFTITTVLWTVDRFTTNVWPRDVFRGTLPGLKDSFGHDVPELSEGPVGAKMYEATVRATGRIAICSTNGLFFTMMHTFFNWWHERATWVDLDGWAEANQRIHRVMGWITGIVIIAHCFCMFFPVIIDGWTRVIIMHPEDTAFKGPIFEDKPCLDVEPQIETVCLHAEDIWRQCAMGLMFFILFPISRAVWALRRNWPLCKWLHIICAFVYVIDLIKRRFHPHTWILNIPLLFAYVVDRVLGTWYYRVNPKCPVAHCVKLDDQYMVLFWKCPAKVQPWLGDVYYIKAAGSGCFERPHPFTTMNNHTKRLIVPAGDMTSPTWEGHRFFLDERQRGEKRVFRRAMTEAEPVTPRSTFTEVMERLFEARPNMALLQDRLQEGWDTAAIIQTYRNQRGCGGGRSHTSVLADPETQTLYTSGPYRSAYRRLYNAPHIPPLILIGSGAGGAYLMDFVGFLRECDVQLIHPVQIYYTARSTALFQFVTDHLAPRFVRPRDNLEVHAHLTTNGVEYSPSHEKNDMSVGRMNLQEIIDGAPAQAEVYFCGSPALHDMIDKLCTEKGLVFHGGHSFAS